MWNPFKSLSKNYFLGIDIGTSSIKIVELSFRSQRTHLTNYGWVDFNFEKNYPKEHTTFLSHQDMLKTLLQNVLKKINSKAKESYVSIPGYNGLISIINLPEMNEDELGRAIEFEANKYIPTSLDEVYISWDVVSKRSSQNKLFGGKKTRNNQPGQTQVLLAAVPKEEVRKMEDLIKPTELEIKALELEVFSIARALVGDDLGTFIIIDIGSRATSIILIEKGVIKISRSLDTGGNEITYTIADSFNISPKRAEILKKQKNDFFTSKESMVIIPAIEMIANETKRIITTFKAKNKNARIDAVILSGGTAKLKGIDNYFSNAFGINTQIGDPFKRIVFDKKLSSKIEEMGSHFSVALGLALRGIEEYQRK